MWGPQDPSASQGHPVLRDLKESLAPPATMEHKEPWVWLGAPGEKAREDRMGPQVYLAPQGQHLTSVMQENLDPEACLALRDPLDPQVFWGRKVISGRRVLQVLAFKALKVKWALQVYQGTQGPRALLAPVETQDCQGPRVRKV